MTNEQIIRTDWNGIPALKNVPLQDKELLLAVMITIMENLDNEGVQYHFTHFTYVSRNGRNVVITLLSSITDKLLYRCDVDSVTMFYFCPNIPIIFTELDSINNRIKKEL